MKKRFLCLLVAVTFILSMLPTMAFAESDDIPYTNYDQEVSDSVNPSSGSEGSYQYSTSKYNTGSAFSGYLYFENLSAGELYVSVQDQLKPTEDDFQDAVKIESDKYQALPVTTKNAGDFYISVLSSQTSSANYRFTLTQGLKKVSKPSVKAGKKSLKVSWKAVKGAESYYVYYQTGKTLKKIRTTKSPVTIKKLKSGKKYKVRVQAVKDMPLNDDLEVKGDASAFSKSVKVK